MKTPEEMAKEYCSTTGWLEDDYVWRETEAGFLAGYKAAQEQTNLPTPAKWISVKDRLPDVKKTSFSLRKESSCVLIVSYDNVYVAHLCEKWCDRTHFIFCACDCSCRGHDMEQDEWELDQVTHWMPLPAPPQEEK